jgi:hypothetical protein
MTKISVEVKKMKMKRIMILVTSLALVMVFAASTPALACGPHHETFTWTGIGIGTSPGTVSVTNGVQHVTRSTGEWTYSAAPWGTKAPTATNTQYFTLNLNTLTGTDIAPGVWTYPGAGVTNGVAFLKFNGLGLFTCNGPSVSAYGYTATEGQTYFGLLNSVVATQFGTSGTMRGLYAITESSNGVTVSDPTTHAPMYSISVETWTYWFI